MKNMYICQNILKHDQLMKRVWSILIVLSVYIGSIQAQRDFRKGYIITNRQDTIHGFNENDHENT